jgi:HAMP domain-containing protein
MSRLSDPSRPPGDQPPRVRLAKGQEVSLGCGTLILIAIIVLMFSRGGIGELENEVRRLRSEIGDLKRSVEAQTDQIKALQDKIDKAKG